MRVTSCWHAWPSCVSFEAHLEHDSFGSAFPLLALKAFDRHRSSQKTRVTKMIRGLEHLSGEERLRAGAVQHGEQKAAGRP